MYENDIESIKLAQLGSSLEMEKLIQYNNGLIWSIVKRFGGRGHEMEDLYQIACIGFIKSIQRFDTSFEVKLSTYSVPYMIGEIKRHIRDDGMIKVSRGIKELAIKVKEIQKQYLIQKGKEIGIMEIAKELKVTKEEIALALESGNIVESIENTTFQDQKDGNKISLLEKIATNIDEQELVVNKIAVNNLIESLEDRDKQIIMLRFFKEKTQMQVAKILGITQVQVSRLEKKILQSMKNKLKGVS